MSLETCCYMLLRFWCFSICKHWAFGFTCLLPIYMLTTLKKNEIFCGRMEHVMADECLRKVNFTSKNKRRGSHLVNMWTTSHHRIFHVKRWVIFYPLVFVCSNWKILCYYHVTVLSFNNFMCWVWEEWLSNGY